MFVSSRYLYSHMKTIKCSSTLTPYVFSLPLLSHSTITDAEIVIDLPFLSSYMNLLCVVLHCDHHEVVALPLSLCCLPQTHFYPLSPLLFLRSWVCPPSPLCTPVLPQPQPLPLPPEPPRLTSTAGAHRVSAGLPLGWHHASVCLTHATPLGYCFLAATHYIDPRVLVYHWLSIF